MQRSFNLKGGNLVHFKKNPRYGSWSVNFDKGGIPESLSGRWLLFEDLFDKTNFYLKNRVQFKTEILDEVTPEELKIEYQSPVKYRNRKRS